MSRNLNLWDKPHYVYRCYNAEGDLLYVGLTSSPRKRMSQHKSRSPWFGEVARTRFIIFPDHFKAWHMEARAIAAEQPRHNKNGRTPNGWNTPGWVAA